jgi:uncharacterized membrane protein
MVEQQAAHRFAMERKFLNFNGAAQILGVVFGGLFVLSALGAGAWLLYTGKTLEGFATMVGSLAAVAVAFVKQRTSQQKEMGEKTYGKSDGTTVTKR